MDFMGMHNEENDSKSWMKEPSIEYYQNNFPSMGKNEEIFPQRERKQLSKLPLHEEMEDMGEQKNGHAFLGVNLPHKSKSCFPKIDGFSNSNLDCHTLPIPLQ